MKLSEIKGKTYNCMKAVHGISTIENIPSMREQALKLAELNGVTMVEDEAQFNFEKDGKALSQYIRKPKIYGNDEGKITFRKGGDYYFEGSHTIQPSYGHKLKANELKDNILTVESGNGFFVYTILDEVK